MREPAFWYRPRSFKSHLLRPLAALYGAIAERRMSHEGLDAGIPVLCVGNYHVGGAGKTPTVLALTKVLRDLGETPVVLSRGYGGRLRGPVMVHPDRHTAADIGDEPLMMVREVPVRRGDGIAWRQCLTASLTFDHRVADGVPAAALLQDLARFLAAPGDLLPSA